MFREKLLKALSYKKGTHKMLMKRTPVVSFTNISQAAFAPISFIKKLQTQTISTEKGTTLVVYFSGFSDSIAFRHCLKFHCLKLQTRLTYSYLT